MYDRSKAHYVVATSIIMKDNKFLIAKRAPHEKVHPNLWTVPGGKLEMSDYIYRHKDTPIHWYNILENVVKREVMEEVGLKIRNLNYLTSMVFLRPDGIPTIIISLFADHHEGSVALSRDLTDYRWVTLEEAKDYRLIDGIYEELVMLDKRIRGEETNSWKKE
ncbi:NUDIX hydrolase [Nanoarchaeota archaeon]